LEEKKNEAKIDKEKIEVKSQDSKFDKLNALFSNEFVDHNLSLKAYFKEIFNLNFEIISENNLPLLDQKILKMIYALKKI
jgi:hypothetical protein